LQRICDWGTVDALVCVMPSINARAGPYIRMADMFGHGKPVLQGFVS
jgi:hypothetical protein